MSGILNAFSGGSYGSPPANTVAPAVTGTATFGQTLSSTTGTWTGVPTPTFAYQWYRSPSTAITSATSSTYVLVAADVGNTIYCKVTATNAISSVSADSNTTATVAATVPGAPTIGTATATSSTTATVAYTAPASNGGATITSYTATSSPGGITGTLSQAGSGTITVSGLTGGTAYTFTVYATNSVGNSAASSASNGITTTPVIGQSFGGGYFAGQISTAGNSVADFNLVVGPVASSQNISIQWKTTTTSTAGTDSVIDGPSNSNAMNNASHPAAQFCKAVTAGGYSDWYMPAQNELEVCYFNLKPTTQANQPYGINPNAVPARTTTYTNSPKVPDQTSATNFRSTGSESFLPTGSFGSSFWSSTQFSGYRAWLQYFNTGYQPNMNKNGVYKVRAIRRVAV